MAKYRVTSLVVTPTKQEYAPGEVLTVHIRCVGERWAESALDWGKNYFSDYYLASTGQKFEDRQHLHESAKSTDGFVDDFVFPFTNPGPGRYDDSVIVKCR